MSLPEGLISDGSSIQHKVYMGQFALARFKQNISDLLLYSRAGV